MVPQVGVAAGGEDLLEAAVVSSLASGYGMEATASYEKASSISLARRTEPFLSIPSVGLDPWLEFADVAGFIGDMWKY
ncbi:hypothetical protein EYZ11_005249 [Aspergillus tanneri]|uniref:Uncharacterized protein n=1 Tax=Aspergillus tanneri TaxID=1220188 RepID=A0A4S3JIR9_9EURO|nr:hypothetical protein EYZ11_005249 [Aspergillus tanneri]